MDIGGVMSEAKENKGKDFVLNDADIKAVRAFLLDSISPASALYDNKTSGGFLGFGQTTERVLNTQKVGELSEKLTSGDRGQIRWSLMLQYNKLLAEKTSGMSEEKMLLEKEKLLKVPFEKDEAIAATKLIVEEIRTRSFESDVLSASEQVGRLEAYELLASGARDGVLTKDELAKANSSIKEGLLGKAAELKVDPQILQKASETFEALEKKSGDKKLGDGKIDINEVAEQKIMDLKKHYPDLMEKMGQSMKSEGEAKIVSPTQLLQKLQTALVKDR